MVRLQLLGRGKRDRLRPLHRLLLAGRQLAQEVHRLVALAEQPPDEGMAGGRGEVGVVPGAVRQVEAEVGLAVDPDAGQGDGPVGQRQRLDGVLVVAQLLAGERRVVDGDLGAVLLRQQVIGDVVAVHRVLGLAGGDEDVLRSGHLVGDRVDLLVQLGKRLGEDALVLDREVVETVYHASRSHIGKSSKQSLRTGPQGRRRRRNPRTRGSLYGWNGVAGRDLVYVPRRLSVSNRYNPPPSSLKGRGRGGRKRPRSKPVAQPPRWAELSMPFTEKPKTTLTAAQNRSCMRSDLACGVSISRRLTRNPMRAPSRPKMAPDAPAESATRLNITLAREPAMPLRK